MATKLSNFHHQPDQNNGTDVQSVGQVPTVVNKDEGGWGSRRLAEYHKAKAELDAVPQDQATKMQRRAVLATLLRLGALGVVATVGSAVPYMARSIYDLALEGGSQKEIKEKDLEEAKLLEAKDREGNLIYVKDEISKNCFVRNGYIWKVLQKIDSDKWDRTRVYVQNCNGEEVTDVEGRPVVLARFVADLFKKADKLMFDEKKEHIILRQHFRTNKDQGKIYTDFVETRVSQGKDPLAAAGVGLSFHEAGLAIDVVNWIEAQKYLVRAEFIGGMYSNNTKNGELFRNVDANHFSWGELRRDIDLAEDSEGGISGWLKEKFGQTKEWGEIKIRLMEFDRFQKKLGEKGSVSYMDQAKIITKLLGY